MKAKHRASGRARGGICKLKKTKDGENGEWIVDSASWIPREAATLRVVAGSDVRALIWIFTPTVFWSMIRELYGVGGGRIVESDGQVRRLSATADYFRLVAVLAIAVAFLSSVWAIGVPFPGAQGSRSSLE